MAPKSGERYWEETDYPTSRNTSRQSETNWKKLDCILVLIHGFSVKIYIIWTDAKTNVDLGSYLFRSAQIIANFPVSSTAKALSLAVLWSSSVGSYFKSDDQQNVLNWTCKRLRKRSSTKAGELKAESEPDNPWSYPKRCPYKWRRSVLTDTVSHNIHYLKA